MQGLQQALFHGGDVLPRDNAAHDLVHELEPDPRGSGSTSIHASPYWPWPPVCFLYFPCAFAPGADGLLVGDLRGLHLHVHPELPPELLDGHLEMDLAHAGQDHLLGLFVENELQRRVLVEYLVDADAHLVLVAPGLGLDGVGHHRVREFRELQDDGLGLGAQGVPGQSVLELRGGAIWPAASTCVETCFFPWMENRGPIFS